DPADPRSAPPRRSSDLRRERRVAPVVRAQPPRGAARPGSRRTGRAGRRRRRGRVEYNSSFMSFETLLVDRDNAVAVVTINRPKVLNALSTQTIDDLERAMRELQRDDAVRAIVLTGAGDKSFVAGADINELAVLSPAEGQRHARRGQAVFDLIEHLGKPVIAAVNGFALGGGCELAMACTIRI